MNVPLKSTFSLVLLASMVAASIFGCAQIRELTYPEGFTYLEKSEVESLMRRMGEGIGRLDQLVAEAPTSDATQQQKIIAELNSLESIATRLSGGHTQTNQFHISDHIDRFISDVGTAKMFAKLDPPKYFKAGEITNSCMECHEHR